MAFKTKSAVVQFADFIGNLIVSGKLKSSMPSVRELAASHQVSSVTVQGAIRMLAARGLVELRGPKRRARVIAAASVAAPAAVSLLVVRNTPVRRLPVSVSASLVLLERQMAARGWGFAEVDVAGLPAENAAAAVRRAMADRGSTHLLCIHPTQALHDAIAGLPIPLAILAVEPIRGRKATRLQVPHGSVPRLALRKAAEAGHRRLCFVDNVLSPARRRQLRQEAAEQGVHLVILPAGRLGAADNWIHHPARIREVCERVRQTHSTCLILPQWADFSACVGNLERLGLKVPAALSLIVVYRNGSIDTHHGLAVAGCEIPEDLAARLAMAWISGESCDEEAFAAPIFETWRDGETLRRNLRSI